MNWISVIGFLMEVSKRVYSNQEQGSKLIRDLRETEEGWFTERRGCYMWICGFLPWSPSQRDVNGDLGSKKR